MLKRGLLYVGGGGQWEQVSVWLLGCPCIDLVLRSIAMSSPKNGNMGKKAWIFVLCYGYEDL